MNIRFVSVVVVVVFLFLVSRLFRSLFICFNYSTGSQRAFYFQKTLCEKKIELLIPSYRVWHKIKFPRTSLTSFAKPLIAIKFFSTIPNTNLGGTQRTTVLPGSSRKNHLTNTRGIFVNAAKIKNRINNAAIGLFSDPAFVYNLVKINT